MTIQLFVSLGDVLVCQQIRGICCFHSRVHKLKLCDITGVLALYPDNILFLDVQAGTRADISKHT